MAYRFLRFLATLTLITSALHLSGQPYQTSLGARIGYPLTVSAKHFLQESIAIEANAGLRAFSGYRWIVLGAAGLKHKPLDVLDRLQWYYGAGASLYFWRFKALTQPAESSLGLQGYLGLDYTFRKSPVNVTIDWTPTFFIKGYTPGLGTRFGGLGIRYVLR